MKTLLLDSANNLHELNTGDIKIIKDFIVHLNKKGFNVCSWEYVKDDISFNEMYSYLIDLIREKLEREFLL